MRGVPGIGGCKEADARVARGVKVRGVCGGGTRVHTGVCAWRRRGAHGDALGDEARDAAEDDMHLELELGLGLG